MVLPGASNRMPIMETTREIKEKKVDRITKKKEKKKQKPKKENENTALTI